MNSLLEDVEKLLEYSNKVRLKIDAMPEKDILNSIGLTNIRLSRYLNELKTVINKDKG